MMGVLETRGGRIAALWLIEVLAMLLAYWKVPLSEHIALATLPVLLAVLSDGKGDRKRSP